jgi:hypothetical protein
MYLSSPLVVFSLISVAVMSHAAPAVDFLFAQKAVVAKREASWQVMASPACSGTVAQCYEDNWYKNQPKSGYSPDAKCRAMKATYKCIVQSVANCPAKEVMATYNAYVAGYEKTCPN